MLEEQYNNIIYERFSGVNEIRTIAALLCTKGILGDKIFLRFGGEWIDWQNPGFDPSNPGNVSDDFSKFSVVVGVSAVTPISFD